MNLVISFWWPLPTPSEVPLLPRSKFISLILLTASAYLLRGKPFSNWEMNSKTMSWEVYVRNEMHIISYWEEWRSGLTRSEQSKLQGKHHARLLIYCSFLTPNFISKIIFPQSFRVKKQKFRHSSRNEYDLRLLRIATVQEHGVRAEVVVSRGCVLSTKGGGAMIACSSKHFFPQDYHLFSVQPQRLTSTASTETANDVITFFFTGWWVNSHFCPYLLF